MKIGSINLHRFAFGVVCISLMQACQSFGHRMPSEEKQIIDTKNLEESYAINIDLDNLRYEEKKLKSELNSSTAKTPENPTKEKLRDIQIKIKSKEDQLREHWSLITSKASELNSGIPQQQWSEYEGDFRVQKEKIVIEKPDDYSLADGNIVREFKLELTGTTNYQLGIVNKFWNPKREEIKEDSNEKDDRKYFDATIKCDADFKIKRSLLTKTISKNKNYSFKIYEQSSNSPKVFMNFTQQVGSCEMLFKDYEHPEKSYGVRFVSDREDKGQIAQLKNRFQSCILPDASALKGVEKLFLTPKYDSMTCADEINDIKTLEEPIDGLKAKAETLLGQNLSEEFLTKMNPYAELDFSKAPKLNTILISYLVFRHDFYGTLIARLAKWHADHGAQVRILMSDVIANKKDRIMLHSMVESSNNIKIQEFKYDSDGGGIVDHFSELHRTMHVKLLITLADNPIDNVVYIGGRNVHDGFVFMQTPDHSAFPELVQYGSQKGADEGYAPWRDYEMRIRSKKFAETIASHYLTLWQRDSQTFYVRSINQNIVSKTPADPTYFDRAQKTALIRHFMSIPYKDDEALEKLYVDIFDSAEKSIRISTPYFRPTKKLGEALERAVARGVDVSLITRLDLKGDTADIILSDVNKEGVNQFLHKIRMFEYLEPGVILHSKIVLVDGKVSFIGSVNLNKRSFVHDMESGVMVYNPAYNKRMNEIMDGYKKQTREISEKLKVALWKKIIIGTFDKEF